MSRPDARREQVYSNHSTHLHESQTYLYVVALLCRRALLSTTHPSWTPAPSGSTSATRSSRRIARCCGGSTSATSSTPLLRSPAVALPTSSRRSETSTTCGCRCAMPTPSPCSTTCPRPSSSSTARGFAPMPVRSSTATRANRARARSCWASSCARTAARWPRRSRWSRPHGRRLNRRRSSSASSAPSSPLCCRGSTLRSARAASARRPTAVATTTTLRVPSGRPSVPPSVLR